MIVVTGGGILVTLEDYVGDYRSISSIVVRYIKFETERADK